jgi:hypothetical protein
MLADGPFKDSFMHQFYISVLLEGFSVVSQRMRMQVGFYEFEIFNVNSEAFYIAPLFSGYAPAV